MRAVVVVRGSVDERDVWPYATWTEGDGERTTLAVQVHDSQELVGVLSSLAALGLEVISSHLIGEPSRPGEQRRGGAISSWASDAASDWGDDSEEQ